jgi:hypothetical protein
VINPLWERQPGESTQAFAAFVIYRDLGAARSLRASYARQKGVEDGPELRANGRLYAWSADHNWVERAAAWDAEQDRIRRQAHQEEVAAMSRRHVQVARLFQNQVVKRFQALTDNEVMALKPFELAKFFELAVKVEREALGQHDERNINLTVIFRRAQELAEQLGVTVQEIMAEAENEQNDAYQG